MSDTEWIDATADVVRQYVKRIDDAEAIVRLVAAADPMVSGAALGGDDWCKFCHGGSASHGAACPWRLAKEWAESMDAARGGKLS